MLQLPPRSINDLSVAVTGTATLLFALVDTAVGSSVAPNAQMYYGNQTDPGAGVSNVVSIRPENGDIRVAIGATPTATKGFLVKQGTRVFFQGNLQDMKLIRVGSSSITTEVVFWQATPGEVVTGFTDAGSAAGPGIGAGSAIPNVDSYGSAIINAVTGSDQTLIAAPGANKQIWVYGIAFMASIAGTVALEDSTPTALTGPMNFGVTSGLSIPASGGFAQPLFKCGTDKALRADVVTTTINGAVFYAIVSV